MDTRRLMLFGIDPSVPLEEQALDYFIPPIDYEEGSSWKYGSHNGYFYLSNNTLSYNTIGSYDQTRPLYQNSPLYNSDKNCGLLILWITDNFYSIMIHSGYTTSGKGYVLRFDSGGKIYSGSNDNENGIAGYSYFDGIFSRIPKKIGTVNYSATEYVGSFTGFFNVPELNQKNMRIYILPLENSTFEEIHTQLLSQITS